MCSSLGYDASEPLSGLVMHMQGQKSPNGRTPERVPTRMARSKSHNQLRELNTEDEDGAPEVTAKSFTSAGTAEGSSDWGAATPQEQVGNIVTRHGVQLQQTCRNPALCSYARHGNTHCQRLQE